MVHASSRALNRLATDERGSGTDRPGCTGGRHTWGRQRQDHPPIHSMIPGAGLSADRTAWLPARANCCVPVKALAPIDRALGKEDLRQGGRREDIAPQVWTLPWNGHRQAKPHGPAACTSRAPAVFTVAIATRRLGSLTDRTVPCTSRQVGRTRRRTAHLDVMECLRRCLQHVWPEGWVKVRPCGLRHARCVSHARPSAC